MKKYDMIATVAAECGVSQEKAAAAVDGLFRDIAAALREEGRVRLPELGTIKVKRTEPTKGRHPQTGAEIDIPAGLRGGFKPSTGFREAAA